MKKIKGFCGVMLVMLSLGCTRSAESEGVVGNMTGECGRLSVSVEYETAAVRSLAQYEEATSEESKVYILDVLVFDAVSKRLERSASVNSIPENVEFELPVGEKLVYAVVNGKDMTDVRHLDTLLSKVEDLSSRSFKSDGFVMIGHEACTVASKSIVKPEIVVKRLVSRVELRTVTCNVPVQYDSMKVESVFLGNAHSVQPLSGEASVQVNKGGYADADGQQPIGLDGIVGACPEYMYCVVDTVLNVGETSSQPIYMYCQPDSGKVQTCMYMLVTIGDGKYYYRVPLNKGLAANKTCVVDVVITNLGSPVPPDGDVQKGEIQAVVKVVGWLTGEEYHAEF